MHIRTEEKAAVTPQKTEPDLPVSVQESSGGVAGGGLLQVWVTGCSNVHRTF